MLGRRAVSRRGLQVPSKASKKHDETGDLPTPGNVARVDWRRRRVAVDMCWMLRPRPHGVERVDGRCQAVVLQVWQDCLLSETSALVPHLRRSHQTLPMPAQGPLQPWPRYLMPGVNATDSKLQLFKCEARQARNMMKLTYGDLPTPGNAARVDCRRRRVAVDMCWTLTHWPHRVELVNGRCSALVLQVWQA